MGRFCDITTRNELADFLDIPRKKLTHILYIKHVDNYYTSFEIPKKSGEPRHINAPKDDLKSVQKTLAGALWVFQESIWQNKGVCSNISHAFEKNKGIITNAKIHKNKRFVLNIDLENFFDSFHFGRVRGFFEKNRDFELPIEVATVIAQLACYEGRLPQGAPSSPIITNIICQILDVRLLKIAKKYKLDYTRYADDLTFSTNDKSFLDVQSNFCKEISKAIEHAGFQINNEKTRLQYKDSQQKVTGLVVNRKVNIDHKYYRRTRAMAYSLYKNGNFDIDGSLGTINQLEGRFSFINQIDWYNNKLDKKPHNIFYLNGREKQYQKFLFFRYFYSNDKPLIVTEGKTDIAYIKAALKNLYLEYPRLITKKDTGEFEFKISFLNKTKRLSYFLDISQDGADAMKKIYNFFSRKGDKRNYTDYFSAFNKICESRPKNPVVLLFDNELENKEKPLYNFAKHANLCEPQKASLITNQYVRLIDDGNLYLLTNPLVDGKDECEVEDLFDTETLSHTIKGKSFSRDDKPDSSKHYGKEIFSSYITANYTKIDFSNFRNILNSLDKILETY